MLDALPRVTGTRDGEPGLAFGLAGIADWSVQQPFLDVFKTARDWIGSTPETYAAMDAMAIQTSGLLDADGYLTAMPDGISHVETYVLTEIAAEAEYMAGRYRLSFDGAGEVRVNFAVQNVVHGDGEIWFDYVPDGSGLVGITIYDTDPQDTGDYLRNFSLVKEEDLPLFEAGEVFRPTWLEVIDGAHAVRFMDWMRTNNATLETWQDRPTLTSASWANGVPVEIMVRLANETGAEPWFTIPHNATDDFIARFAAYVRDALDPGLRAHFEFSNEVWNFIFQQAGDSVQDALTRFGQDVEGGWMQEYGVRAAEMLAIVRDAFGDDEDRVVGVFATHTHWRGLESYALEAPAHVAASAMNVAPAGAFDTYAITGYFSGALGLEKAETVLGWIAESEAIAIRDATALGLQGDALADYLNVHRYDYATDLAVRELRDGAVTGDPRGSLQELFALFAYHKAVAEAYGMDLVMYEGGTHVVGVGEWVNNPDLTAFFIHLNYSPGMGVLYAELLDGWVDAGGSLFNAFVDVDRPGKWGSWGSLRHLEDSNPRDESLDAFRDLYPVERIELPAGLFLEGTAGPDRLEGSEADDHISASAGDDTVIGGGGDDTIEYRTTLASVTLRIEGPEVVVLDRSGQFGQDRLAGIETALFSPADGATDGATMPISIDLAMLQGYASLDVSQLTELTELYIATFGRAPDALGLAFWADQIARGATIDSVAVQFMDQPEAHEIFGTQTMDATFIARVYLNVLDREPDEVGQAFWLKQMHTGAVSRADFIVELLRGVEGGRDALYLSRKVELGMQFAIEYGLSDAELGRRAFDGYDGTAQAAADTATLIEAMHRDVLSEPNGGFLMPLVGSSAPFDEGV